jgi:hypothetical protein
MKKFLVLCLFGMGCVTASEASQELHYSKDHRTKLCFASRSINGNNAVMTNVPCTPDVEILIEVEQK